MQNRAFSLHDEDGRRGHLDEISHFKIGAYFTSFNSNVGCSQDSKAALACVG